MPNDEALQAFLGDAKAAAVTWLPPREGFGYQAARVDMGSDEARRAATWPWP